MIWNIPAAKIARLAVVAGGGVMAQLALRQAGFYELAARETEGLTVLITLVGDIYAVLLAFAIFVVWGQFTEVEDCVMRESSALDDLLRFSYYLNPDARAAIRRSVTEYAQYVLKHEWAALGEGRRDRRAEELFSQAMGAAIEVVPANDAERAIHGRLLDLAQQISKHRDERVSRSLTRMPATLSTLVNVISGVLLLLLFVYPFHHWAAGAAAFAVTACVLFLADFVLMDTDNPLQGSWNVSPRPFGELNA